MNELSLKAMRAQWAATGFYFGYPRCCIQAFIQTPLAVNRDWDNPWEGTGYIPCRICATKPMMEVMGAINNLRSIELPPFPSQEV